MRTEIARTFLPISAAAGRLGKSPDEVVVMTEDGSLDTLEGFGQLWVAESDVDNYARSARK